MKVNNGELTREQAVAEMKRKVPGQKQQWYEAMFS